MVGRLRGRGENAFTLIELLIVLSIIGILASLAIPTFGTYRRRAVDSNMQASLNAGRQSMEAYYEGNDYTYVGADAPTLESYGYPSGDGSVTLVVIEASGTHYLLRACSQGGSGPSFILDSRIGTIDSNGTDCS